MFEGVSSKDIRNALLQGVAGGLLLAGVFAAGYFYHDYLNRRPVSEVSFALLSEVDGLLQTHFLFEPPAPQDRIYAATQCLAQSYGDPNTFFVEPQSAEIENTNRAGAFGGIGVEVGFDEQGRVIALRVYRDGPAERAGMASGDVITEIDGQSVDASSLDMDGIVSLIRGEVGSTVRIAALRGDEALTFEITREEVLVPSAFWELSDADDRIGVIQIRSFTERTSDEVGLAVEELRAQGADGIVLDLRDNRGGLLDIAVSVTGYFLDGGVVLYQQSHAGETIENAPAGRSSDLPLVVLVNQNTASAAEILAGALQDRDRAALVGQPTYGKGSVQTVYSLSDGSSLHITTSQWFTPDRQRIEEDGLTPDYIVEIAPGRDTEMEQAISLLTAALAQ